MKYIFTTLYFNSAAVVFFIVFLTFEVYCDAYTVKVLVLLTSLYNTTFQREMFCYCFYSINLTTVVTTHLQKNYELRFFDDQEEA